MNFGIIAAGDGSRLEAEGVAYPKPLVPLGGVPMIGRLIEIFKRFSPDRICVVVNERMPEVADYIRNVEGVQLIVKSTPSSMHSFYEVASALAPFGRFVVTTVDTIFNPEDFARYVERYASAEESVDGMMALTQFIDDEKPLYVDVDCGMRIVAFRDSPSADTRFVSGGIYGLGSRSVDVLNHCLEQGMSRMRNYQRALLSHGLQIEGYDMGKIIDVDHATDIRVAEDYLGLTN